MASRFTGGYGWIAKPTCAAGITSLINPVRTSAAIGVFTGAELADEIGVRAEHGQRGRRA